MDAVGRLAGGVAGDFNNVLTVITGYSDLLRAQIPAASPLRRFADEILYAGERAAALTRQLLTFSSGQAAQPKVSALNGAITGMEPMLRRLLGDSVELIVLPGPALGPVQIDGAQMQQAIMNLATNAREAMPNGGKLVLETSNLELDEAAGKKGRREARRIRDAGRERYGIGHGRRDPLAIVRAVLHHQGARQRQRVGALHGLRHREAERGLHHGLQPGELWHHIRDLPAPRGAGHGGSPSAPAGGVQRLGDHPAGG